RDTVFPVAAEGMPERRISVGFGQDTVEGTIVGDRVWRLEVRSPHIRTIDSVGIGTRVGSIRSTGVRFLGYGEDGPFIKLATHCGLSLKLNRFTGRSPLPRSLSDIPDTATVDLILVVTC